MHRYPVHIRGKIGLAAVLGRGAGLGTGRRSAASTHSGLGGVYRYLAAPLLHVFYGFLIHGYQHGDFPLGLCLINYRAAGAVRQVRL